MSNDHISKTAPSKHLSGFKFHQRGREEKMSLSAPSITNLLDLVEIRISCFQVFDREDEREMKNLELCRAELLEMQTSVIQSSVVLEFPMRDRNQLSQ